MNTKARNLKYEIVIGEQLNAILFHNQQRFNAKQLIKEPTIRRNALVNKIEWSHLHSALHDAN